MVTKKIIRRKKGTIGTHSTGAKMTAYRPPREPARGKVKKSIKDEIKKMETEKVERLFKTLPREIKQVEKLERMKTKVKKAIKTKVKKEKAS